MAPKVTKDELVDFEETPSLQTSAMYGDLVDNAAKGAQMDSACSTIDSVFPEEGEPISSAIERRRSGAEVQGDNDNAPAAKKRLVDADPDAFTIAEIFRPGCYNALATLTAEYPVEAEHLKRAVSLLVKIEKQEGQEASQRLYSRRVHHHALRCPITGGIARYHRRFLRSLLRHRLHSM